MKKFKDLEFKTHEVYPMYSTQATLNFENDYGISVITRDCAYTSYNAPYEVAVLYKGELTYETHITNDVLGYQKEEDVTNIMIEIQKL